MSVKVGARIYYDKTTGAVLVNTGDKEFFGSIDPVLATGSIEQDFKDYVALAERNPNTVGVIELKFKQHERDFAKAMDYRVNPQTLKLEFFYPDPNAPTPPTPVFQPPLTEQVSTLQTEVTTLKAVIDDLILGGGAPL